MTIPTMSVAAGHTPERTRLEPVVDALPDASGGAPHRESSYELHLFSSEVTA